jgi:hypothetical protein
MFRSLALAGATLLLGAAAACGGGSTDQAGSEADTQAYCKALESTQKEFGSIDSGTVNPANLDRLLDRIHTLAGQAPRPVADDWKMLDGAFTRLRGGLDDLGLSFKDLSDPSKLAEADPQKLQRFGRQMQQLGGQQFDKAGNAIERHAKQVCHINLDKS